MKRTKRTGDSSFWWIFTRIFIFPNALVSFILWMVFGAMGEIAGNMGGPSGGALYELGGLLVIYYFLRFLYRILRWFISPVLEWANENPEEAKGLAALAAFLAVLYLMFGGRKK